MARMSIYVTDSLKERMDAIETVNWSSVAQDAFEREIRLNQPMKGDKMNATIERLRASKESYIDDVFESASSAGQSWATDRAEYAQLKKMAEACEGEEIDKDSDVSIAHILGLDRQDENDLWENVFGNEKPRALYDNYEAFQAGFVAGALKIWEQVSTQI